MADPVTSAAISAATAGPGPVDIATLERAFVAFVAYPGGEGLSGFDGPDSMLSAFTDGVCVHLVGDFSPLPEPVLNACLDYAGTYFGTLHGFTYKDAAAMAVSSWQGFRERFATAIAEAG